MVGRGRKEQVIGTIEVAVIGDHTKVPRVERGWGGQEGKGLSPRQDKTKEFKIHAIILKEDSDIAVTRL